MIVCLDKKPHCTEQCINFKAVVLKGFKRVSSEKNLKRFCTYSSASASACWWSSKSIIVSASKSTFRISRRSSPPRAYRCRLHMGWRKTAVGRVTLSSSVLHKPRPQFWTGVRCFPARPALVSTSERVKAIPVGVVKSTTITTSEAALFGFIITIARSVQISPTQRRPGVVRLIRSKPGKVAQWGEKKVSLLMLYISKRHVISWHLSTKINVLLYWSVQLCYCLILIRAGQMTLWPDRKLSEPFFLQTILKFSMPELWSIKIFSNIY